MSTTYQASIKTTYPQVYQKFFSEYEFILSGHLGFNWFPVGMSDARDFVNIKQKIRAKSYVGIRKIPQSTIAITEIQMYNGKEFLQYGKEYSQHHYPGALEKIAQSLGLDLSSGGYQIAILSERSRGEGLGFSGNIFAMIVLGLGIVSGKYPANLLDEYAKFASSPLLKEIVDIVETSLGDQINKIVGSSSYSTLLESAHPIVYLKDSRDKNSTEYPDYAQDITKLLQIQDPIFSTLPIRRAMIYTGQRANVQMVNQQKQFIELKNNSYSQWFLEQGFNSLDSILHQNFSQHTYHQGMMTSINHMSVKTLYLFAQIYQYGLRIEFLKELTDHLNSLNKLYNDIEEDSDITEDFHHACNLHHVSIHNFGFFPIYTSRFGGNYIVVFEDASDSQVLEKIIQSMQTSYPHIHIVDHYHFDAPPQQGVRIEQDIYHHIYQQHTGQYLLLDNQGNQQFIDYSTIDSTQMPGLFLDAVKGRIHLNGIPLTSKELRSQSTTIEVFDLLLRSADKSIRNQQLGPSSFSGQQNQMVSKIVSPLIKIIKQTTGEDFPLQSKGSLKDFYILLGESKLPIQLIKKI